MVIITHLMISPFTKVEESFTIQAIHDILKYGVTDISQYDHLKFPGVVPRTFVGSLVIAAMTKPFIYVSSFLSQQSAPTSGFEAQLLARCMIGLTNGLSLVFLKNKAQKLIDSVQKKKNKSKESPNNDDEEPPSTIGGWFSVFCLSQFHLMYYSSRSLPNFVGALPLSNIVVAYVLGGDAGRAIGLCAFTTVVFRLELGAMCAGLSLFSIIYKQASVTRVIKYGLIGAIFGSALTVFADSYFWQRWTFPEMDAFVFNIVNGQSSKWGTKPFVAYFTGFLPMMFMPPTVLLLNYLGFKIAPKPLKVIALASFFHVFVLSFQPHKEWRFIIYAIPPITLLGSHSASYLFENMDPGLGRATITRILLLLSPVVSLSISAAFLYISSMNYPGGQALMSFNDYILLHDIKNVTVHIDVPACMTGVTLFGELNDQYGITYDKTEDVQELTSMWPSFDYLILSQGDSSALPTSNNNTKWELIHTTKAFAGFNTSYLAYTFENQYSNGFSIVHHLLEEQSFSPLVDLVKNTIIQSDLLFTYKKVDDLR